MGVRIILSSHCICPNPQVCEQVMSWTPFLSAIIYHTRGLIKLWLSALLLGLPRVLKEKSVCTELSENHQADFI